MKILIELEGAVMDVWPVWFELHRRVAKDVGWSSLDAGTFRRLTRKEGREADVLRGAKPIKIAAYYAKFDEHVESDVAIARHEPHSTAPEVLARLARFGSVSLVTAGSNVAGRNAIVARIGVSPAPASVLGLSPDPRRRPGEFRILADGEPRTIVAAATDSVIRAAVSAGLFTVGISCGACSEARLHRAGAAVVYRNLQCLAESLAQGGEDMVRVGLLPFSGG